MTGIELRPRSGTEIVDAAFQLYRRYFAPLVTISAVFLAPLILLNLLLTGGGNPAVIMARPGAAVGLVLAAWIIGSLSEAGVVLAVSDSVMTGVMDAGSALRRTFRHALKILAAALLKWFIIMFMMTLAFAIIPPTVALIGGNAFSSGALSTMGGIMIVVVLIGFAIGGGVGMFYYSCYFAVSAAVIVEGLGVGASLKRSRALSKGLRRKVLSTLGTPMFILIILQFVIALIAQSLVSPIAIRFVVQQAVTIVLTPIVAVIATLLYYDARIRNEGFDLEVMTAELAPPGVPVTPGT